MSNLSKILVSAGFVNALSWVVLIPIWQYPDEQSHFAQVQDIAEFGSTPKLGPNTSEEVAVSEKFLDTERDGLGNNKFTYHPEYHISYTTSDEGVYEKLLNALPNETKTYMYKWEATDNPPLYHVMASNFYNLFRQNNLLDRVFAVRIFSLFLFLCLIVISINAGNIIFKKDILSQTVLPALMTFTPMLVFSTTGVLPDPLTILLFTLIFTISAKIVRDKLTIQLFILLIILLFLGTFTRQQFQVAIPIVLISVYYGLSKMLPKRFVIYASTAITLCAFILGAIFAVKHKLIFSVAEIGSPDLRLLLTSQFEKYLLSTLSHYYSQTLPWYWGVYKWLSLTLPHIYYQIINRIIVLSVIGLGVWIAITLRNKKIFKQDLIMALFIFSIFIYFAVFIIWDFYFQLVFGYSFGIQGRYFLPLALPITTLLLFGIKNLFQLFIKKYLHIALFILTFIMVLFNDVSLYIVTSSYYESVALKTFTNQVSQYKPLIFKGDTVIIILVLNILMQLTFLFYLFNFISTKNEKYR